MAIDDKPSGAQTNAGIWLIVLAALGLSGPGGLFLVGVFQHSPVSAAASDLMAWALLLDLVMCTLLLAYHFARRPPGPVRWPWFVVLSLATTLACGIPIYLWLNWRRTPSPRPSLATWLKTI